MCRGKIVSGVYSLTNFFFLISNKFYWYKKRDTLVHMECTRGQQIKYKNGMNLGNQ